jgi:protein phosphatase
VSPRRGLPVRYRLDAGVETDPGRRVDPRGNPKNEDVGRFWDDLRLYIVADSVGGHAGGDVAAELAVSQVHDVLAPLRNVPLLATDRRACLVEAIERANKAVWQLGNANAQLAGMGSTIVAAWWCPPAIGSRVAHFAIAHVGDSRAYLCARGGAPVQLTRDHSLVNLYRDWLPRLSEEQLAEVPTNIITRSLGAEETVAVDSRLLETEPGDVLLLCTDGLHECVTIEEMGRCLRHAPAIAAKRLVRRALQHRAQDNVTALVVGVTA